MKTSSPLRKRRSPWTALVVVAAALFCAIAIWLGVAKPLHVSVPTTSSSSASAPGAARKPRAMGRSAPRRPIAPPFAEPTETTGDIGALEGRVIASPSLEGIAGATVSWTGGEDDFTITTGSDGRFRFEPPVEGTYSIVRVTKPGYWPRDFEDEAPMSIVAKRGGGLRGIEIALDPEVRYRGIVIGPSDAVVEGATVRMLEVTGERTLKSGRDGRFEIIAPEGALLEATHPDFAPGRARIDIAAQIAKSVTIRLGPASERRDPVIISGRVRDRRGDPIESALVVAAPSSSMRGSDTAPMGRATTNAYGEFVIGGLDPTSYALTATKEGLARATARRVVAPARDVVLEMALGGSIAGTVQRASSGEPVAAFTIVLREATGPLTREVIAAEAFFDAGGAFLLTGVPAGTFSVTALASGLAPSEDAIAIVTDDMAEPANVTLELAAGARIDGTVWSGDPGSPLAGARITLEGQSLSKEDGIPYEASAVSDARGAFSLIGISRGTTTLFAAAEGHHARIVGNVLVPGAVTIHLTPLAEGEEPKIELFGIGAILKAEDDALLVQGVAPGGGAEKAGLTAGDAIVSVDGVAVTELGFTKSIQRIRGPEGTTVELTIRPASGPDKVVSVKRLRVRA